MWDRWILLDPQLAEGYREARPCPSLSAVVERLALQKTSPLSPLELEAWRAQRLFDLDGSAAAGNLSGKAAYASGAILPSAWTDLVYEKDWDCSPYPAAPAVVAGEPLVFAAGALDARGTSSALTRPGSIPHLLVYGEHAQAASATGGPPPISGTSVSTVVLASAAAVVWANDPSLSAGGVMQALYTHSEPLAGLAVDIGPASWGTEPRALQACRAFDGGKFTCAPGSPPRWPSPARSVRCSPASTASTTGSSRAAPSTSPRSRTSPS